MEIDLKRSLPIALVLIAPVVMERSRGVAITILLLWLLWRALVALARSIEFGWKPADEQPKTLRTPAPSPKPKPLRPRRRKRVASEEELEWNK